MNGFDSYLSGILKQILDYFQILTNLQDKANDIEIIKKELTKINGLLYVVMNKLELLDDKSNDFVELLSSVKFYLENHDFFREIETLSKLYSEDSQRIKNLRYITVEALQGKKTNTKDRVINYKIIEEIRIK